MPATSQSRLARLWFTVSSTLVIWDLTYCLLRPHSMPGGAIHHFWKPYALYGRIDRLYGPSALAANDGFTAAQSWLNLAETLLNLLFLAQAGKGDPGASVTGLVATSMTTSKTVLYWLNEICGGWKHTGHNERLVWWTLWVVPNGAWIVVPGYFMWRFWGEVVGVVRKAEAGKKEA